MRAVFSLVFASLVAVHAAACSNTLTLAGSCGGEHSTTCEPYAYSEVAAASLGPAGLRPGQLAASAQVHLELRQCAAMAPRHSVRILARLASPTADGGDGATLMLGEVTDDGSNGDAHADDGVIDAVIGNPFLASAPASADLVLTFVPHAGAHCDGASLDVPYTTGTLYTIGGP